MLKKWLSVDCKEDALKQAQLIANKIAWQDVRVPLTKEELLTIAIRAENIARWARKEAK